MSGSLADALAALADHVNHEAGADRLGRSVVWMREEMHRIAFTLRFLALAAPDTPAPTAGPPDDLDVFVREQAEADPAFAASYVNAEHAARIRAFEDLLASLWLYIGRHTVKQLETGQKNLLADSVDAARARLAEADPAYGEASRVERWWQG